MQVESKYKNPDKYIKKLKGLLDFAWQCHADASAEANDARGDLICFWSKGYSHTIASSTDFSLGQFKPKQKVAMIGIVKSVKMTTCDEGNEESEITYELTETRRLP